MARHVVVTNRKARHDYQALETLEAGIVLTGTEVKSLRNGDAQLAGSYVRIEKGEAFLIDAHIAEYDDGNRYNHEPRRPRKLLLHRREIARLHGLVSTRGMSLIPLRIYFRRGRAKVEIGICRGKKAADRREDLKRRTAEREARAAVSAFHRGR